MKTILCYGDSNTWGHNPKDGNRYPYDRRWTGVLQAALGADYRIIEEGLCGRTTVFDDPLMPGRSGKEFLQVCLDTHAPIDLVMIMLGTNDFKSRFAAPAEAIAQGAGLLAKGVMKSDSGLEGAAPKVLLLAPPEILETGPWSYEFVGGGEKSRRYPLALKAEAEALGIDFFDTGAVASSSPVDGIHLELEDHGAIGAALKNVIAKLL